MEYNFKEIEAKWQRRWQEEETYRVEADPTRPKFYVLDMFPYPSGAGLHVGHPLGYIASDIYSRYKRLCGFNVLHPMGYDAFGLPAEQYAIQTGQHPAVTTERNIARYREQLDKIGFSFDWHREVRTCDPSYYKWTQWAFLEMFKHYYDRSTDKAEPIEKLVARFEAQGTEGLDAACTQEMRFTADEWKSKTEEEREQILQNYRLAFRADTMVNWCPQLGTVLANDEVKDGLSERGGFPVEQKQMKQWLLRVTAYAQRMLDGLERLEWSDSLKEINATGSAVRKAPRSSSTSRAPTENSRYSPRVPTRSSALPSWSSLRSTNGFTTLPRPNNGPPSRSTSPRRRNAPSGSASPKPSA